MDENQAERLRHIAIIKTYQQDVVSRKAPVAPLWGAACWVGPIQGFAHAHPWLSYVVASRQVSLGLPTERVDGFRPRGSLVLTPG